MASERPSWQMRCVGDWTSLEVEPLANGACILRSASLPPSAGVWVGVLMDSPFGKMEPFSVAIGFDPASDGLMLKTSPLLRQPGDELAAGGEQPLATLRNALRDDLPGATTAVAGDTIFVLGAGRGGDASADTSLWAIRNALSFNAVPRAARVVARGAPGATRGAPGRRVLPAMAGHGGALFVIGGAAPSPPRAREPPPAEDADIPEELGLVEKLPPDSVWDCFKFTPNDAAAPAVGGEWSEMPLRGAAPKGGGLVGAASVQMPDGQLLLFCGQTPDGFSADVLSIDLASGEVALLSEPRDGEPHPSARARASAALLADGRHVLLAGGGTDTRDARDAWLFDVHARRFEEVNLDDFGPPDPPEPPPREAVTDTIGMKRTVFGRHTLLLSLPAQGGSARKFKVVQWGGAFVVRPREAMAGQCMTMHLNGLLRAVEITPAAAVRASPGCAACGAANERGDMRCCSRCHKAIYCGPDCQRAHWKQHRKTCAAE